MCVCVGGDLEDWSLVLIGALLVSLNGDAFLPVSFLVSSSEHTRFLKINRNEIPRALDLGSPVSLFIVVRITWGTYYVNSYLSLEALPRISAHGRVEPVRRAEP